MTVSDYPILFEMTFGAPTLGQDTPPTFGTFLSAVNMCIEFLNKVGSIQMKCTVAPSSTHPVLGNIPRLPCVFSIEVLHVI